MDDDLKRRLDAQRSAKRKKQQIKGVVSDSFETANEQESVISTMFPPVRGWSNSSAQKKTRRKPKKASAIFEEDTSDRHKRELIISRHGKRKKQKVSPMEPDDVEGKEHIDSRPLDDWRRTYCYRADRTSDEVEQEIIRDTNLQIDAGIAKRKAEKKEEATESLIIRRKNVKRPVRRIGAASSSSSAAVATAGVGAKEDEEAEEEEDMHSFFLQKHGLDKDENKPLGQEPKEYEIYKELEEEFEVCKEGYLDRCEGYAKRRKELSAPPLEECDFAYCADFLREPRSNAFYKERPCSRGDRCIAMLMAANYPEPIETGLPTDGFICREWLLPSEKKKLEESGILPEDNKLCLLDNLSMMSFLYYNYLYKGTEPIACIQTHYNKVDCVGNYKLDCCILPNPRKEQFAGIVRPIVKFATNHYTYDTVSVEGEAHPLKCVHEQRVIFR